MTTTAPESGRVRRSSKKTLAWAAGAGIAVVAVIAVIALFRGGTGSPGLSSTYRMTFDNLTYDIQTDGSLTDVTEDHDGNVRGQMTVGPRLYGTGPFTGTFASGAITFDGVQNGVYTGTIDADGRLSGTYTYASQQGKWTAIPTGSGPSDGAGLPWWLWAAVAAAVLLVVIAYILLRRNVLPVGRRRSRGAGRCAS